MAYNTQSHTLRIFSRLWCALRNKVTTLHKLQNRRKKDAISGSNIILIKLFEFLILAPFYSLSLVYSVNLMHLMSCSVNDHWIQKKVWPQKKKKKTTKTMKTFFYGNLMMIFSPKNSYKWNYAIHITKRISRNAMVCVADWVIYVVSHLKWNSTPITSVNSCQCQNILKRYNIFWV